MKKNVLSALILFLLAACGSSPTSEAPALLPPSPAPPASQPPITETEEISPPSDSTPEFAPICIEAAPTETDIERALSFPGGLFDSADWERSYTVYEDRVFVYWQNPVIPSIVNLEAVIFPCSYEEPDLDSFFSADAWAVVFGNYESYQYVSECRDDRGLRLYNFIAVTEGEAYQVRYWTLNDTANRIVTFMVVLPLDASAQMDEIAYALFPQLQACP